MRTRIGLRLSWALVAIAATSVVGVMTQRPGFTVITFFGTLWLPRLLFGFGPRGWGHHHHHGWRDRAALERGDVPAPIAERLETWHRQAHGGRTDDTVRTPATSA